MNTYFKRMVVEYWNRYQWIGFFIYIKQHNKFWWITIIYDACFKSSVYYNMNEIWVLWGVSYSKLVYLLFIKRPRNSVIIPNVAFKSYSIGWSKSSATGDSSEILTRKINFNICIFYDQEQQHSLLFFWTKPSAPT